MRYLTIFLTFHIAVAFFQSEKANAATKNWFDSTNIRIDSIRKGNFIIKVRDKDGNSVKDSLTIKLVNHEFTWGITVGPPISTEVFDWTNASTYRFFNSGVNGNEFKWSGVESQAGVFTYAGFDTTLAYTEKIGWPLKGHCLLWGGTALNYHEVPQWVQALNKNAMNDSCKARILRDVARYKGRVHEYDVYNEPTHTHFLTDSIGDSIIWNSFKWAHEADSTSQLYLNDYNLVEWGEYANYLKILRSCLAHGAPIDGIGIQGHFPGRIGNFNSFKMYLDSLAKPGLQMRFTEFDMDVTKDGVSQKDQAMYYSKVLRYSFSYPSITGFYFWGFQDPYVYRAGSGMYNANKTPKPAADTVYNLLHKEWSTNIIDKSNDSSYVFRGFFGKYYVNAKFGSTWKQFSIDCNKSDAGKTYVLKEADGALPKPVLKKARVIAAKKVELTFDKKMGDPQFEKNNFSVYGPVIDSIVSASLKETDSSVIILNLKSNLASDNFVVVSYMGESQRSSDSALLDRFGAEPAENLLIGITNAAILPGGNTIQIYFTKNMTDPSGQLANFTIKVNGGNRIINSVSLKTDSASILILNLASPIKYNDLVVFSYTPGTWESTEGAQLDATGNLNLPNNLLSGIVNSNINKIELYPNPVENILNLTNTGNTQSIMITTITGQEIEKITLRNAAFFDYNASRLAKGVYFIKLVDRSGSSNVMKFIKK